jgi:5-formyltetrahydrofolate cyclo-ligase
MTAQASTFAKTEIRKSVRELLKSRPSLQELEKNNRSLNQGLEELLKSEGGTWAAFQPLDPEPDIRPALSRLTHIDWVFPRVACEYLSFYRVGDTSQMSRGSFGILEPETSHEEVPTADIKGFLVPGLAFDRQGARLGRGRGFYDRTLFGVSAVKIGIAYNRQIMQQSLPVEQHDIAMDLVLTEGELIRNPSSRGTLK